MIEVKENSLEVKSGQHHQSIRVEIPVGTTLKFFKKDREHFLAYAIQMQTKVPSQKSILRTEKRKKKIENIQTRKIPRAIKIRSKFALPRRYGQPVRFNRKNKKTANQQRRNMQFSHILPQRIYPLPHQITAPQFPLGIGPYPSNGSFPPPIIGNIPIGPPPPPPPIGSVPLPLMGNVPISPPPPIGSFHPFSPFLMGSVSMASVMPNSSPINILTHETTFSPLNLTNPQSLLASQQSISNDKSIQVVAESRQQIKNQLIPKPQRPILPVGFGLGSLLPTSIVKVDFDTQGKIQPLVKQNKHMIPKYQNSISLPVQLALKQKLPSIAKQKSKAFKVRSPEELTHKSERAIIIKQLESGQEQIYSKYHIFEPKTTKQEKPEYFKKKKANQKRRRREKHELIKANRLALASIFGDAIFKSGWPVSRKEIKLALGIKEEELQIDLSEFITMAQNQQSEVRTQSNIDPLQNSQK